MPRPTRPRGRTLGYAAAATLLLVATGWFANRSLGTSSAAVSVTPPRDSAPLAPPPPPPPPAPAVSVAVPVSRPAAAPVATGKLRILTSPPSAEILIDGRRVGVGSVVDLQVSTGARRLRVQAAGYAPWDTTIVVQTGLTHILGRVTLRAPDE